MIVLGSVEIGRERGQVDGCQRVGRQGFEELPGAGVARQVGEGRKAPAMNNRGGPRVIAVVCGHDVVIGFALAVQQDAER